MDTESSQTETESSETGEDPLIPFVDDSLESSTSSPGSSECTSSQAITIPLVKHKMLTYKLVCDNIDEEVRL